MVEISAALHPANLKGETRSQFIHLRETARWDLRGGKPLLKILTLKGRIGLDDR